MKKQHCWRRSFGWWILLFKNCIWFMYYYKELNQIENWGKRNKKMFKEMLRCEMATSQMVQRMDRAVLPGQANRKKLQNWGESVNLRAETSVCEDMTASLGFLTLCSIATQHEGGWVIMLRHGRPVQIGVWKQPSSVLFLPLCLKSCHISFWLQFCVRKWMRHYKTKSKSISADTQTKIISGF